MSSPMAGRQINKSPNKEAVLMKTRIDPSNILLIRETPVKVGWGPERGRISSGSDSGIHGYLLFLPDQAYLFFICISFKTHGSVITGLCFFCWWQPVFQWCPISTTDVVCTGIHRWPLSGWLSYCFSSTCSLKSDIPFLIPINGFHWMSENLLKKKSLYFPRS